MMHSHTKPLRQFFTLLAFFAVAACSESLESGAGCPILCPNQNLDLREVVLDAVEYDASVPGFPALGGANEIMLVSSGDTLDSRMIVRFDSIPDRFVIGGDTTPVTEIGDAILRVFIDSSLTIAKEPIVLEVYDVDTTAADANFDAVRSLFRADRLVTSEVFSLTRLKTDTLNIPIPNNFLLAKIQSPSRRARLGLRIRSDSTARLILFTTNRSNFARLRYDPAPNDASVEIFERTPRSHTPLEDQILAANFTDYSLPAAGAFPLRRNTAGPDTVNQLRDSLLAVGGIAGRRIYFRFSIPDSILESSIIRATLILNKKASAEYNVRDTIAVIPQAVFATARVPVSRAVAVNDAAGVFAMPSVRTEPRATGETRFDLINFARSWSVDSKVEIPPAISLRVGLEGQTMYEMLFYSTSGPAALRPKLRVTFVPRR